MAMSERARKNLFWVGIVVAGVVAWQAFAPEHPLVGKRAPEVNELIVVGEGAAEHDRMSLAALRGHVVVLDFWATWCPPCREAIPILSRLAHRYASRGVEFYGVDLEPQLTPEALADADRALGATYPTLVDRSGSLQRAYAVTHLPSIFVIDGRGVVRQVTVGLPDEDNLDAEIRKLLN